MSNVVLDAGALLALDRNDKTMWLRLKIAEQNQLPIITHCGIVGQVWRHPSGQARLAKVLTSVVVVPVDDRLGRAAGLLLTANRSADVIDAALACLCRPGDVLYTSDIDELSALLSRLLWRSK